MVADAVVVVAAAAVVVMAEENEGEASRDVCRALFRFFETFRFQYLIVTLFHEFLLILFREISIFFLFLVNISPSLQ